ncbi:MAG: cysteine synthase A [Allisonella histaminiformans]|uniref:cysteine synthase A n=1 Tax=Allisonella histaminiformans TaxID=209880 RepID=UPI002A80A380|nr:cysteine synthase A [Allisonella histaminiformans]MDY3957479.1 cysteine synthase A [Allisonella histaminiformans]
MSKIYRSILELIGNTPIMEPVHLTADKNLPARLLVKLESFNPAGSIKDRIALSMIEDAEARGALKKGGVIIEPTSGNTGIGLAAVAAVKGYRAIMVMPESMSVERRTLIAAYGAEVVLTPAKLGIAGSVEKAKELAASIPGSFIPEQFDNPANPAIHEKTTGPEIYWDTDGEVDFLVAGVGTGGTLSGTGRYLKSQKPEIKVIAVEPADSPLLAEGKPGPHKIQGIGTNFMPNTLDRNIYDEILNATTEEAYSTAREFIRKEGFLVGISGGAALHAALQVAARPENKGKTVVAILPDNGDRYLSTPGFIKAE